MHLLRGTSTPIHIVIINYISVIKRTGCVA